MQVNSFIGLKKGTAQTNQFDDASLEDVVRRAETLARYAPDDAETMPILGPQTLRLGSALRRRAGQVRRGAAGRGGGQGPGGNQGQPSQAHRGGLHPGLFGRRFPGEQQGPLRQAANHQRLLLPHRPLRGRRAAAGEERPPTGPRASTPIPVTARAIDIATRTTSPVALEPGNYTVILSPECVADLTSTMLNGFDWRQIDEGRSFLTQLKDPLGEGKPIFSEKVNLYTDPAIRRVPRQRLRRRGLRRCGRSDWIQRGVVKAAACSRYWAKKTNRQPNPGVDQSPDGRRHGLDGRDGRRHQARADRDALLVRPRRSTPRPASTPASPATGCSWSRMAR